MLFYAHLQLLIPVSQSDAHKPSRQLLCQGFGKDAQSSTCLCPRSALPSAALTPELVSSTADTRVAHSLGEEGQDFSPTPLAARSLYMVGRGARNSLLWIGVFVLNRGDGGFTNYTHTHKRAHARAHASSPCPPGSRPARPGYSSPFLPGAPARLTRLVPGCHGRRLCCHRRWHCWRSRPRAPLGACLSFSPSPPAPD